MGNCVIKVKKSDNREVFFEEENKLKIDTNSIILYDIQPPPPPKDSSKKFFN